MFLRRIGVRGVLILACGMVMVHLRRYLILPVLLAGTCLAAPPPAQIVVLSPRAIVEFALRSNNLVLAAEYDHRIVEIGRKQALSAFLPKVQADIAFERLFAEPQTGFEQFSRAHIGAVADSYDTMSLATILSDSASLALYVRQQAGRMLGSVPGYPLQNRTLGVSVVQPLFEGTHLLNNYRVASYRELSSNHANLWMREEVRLRALKLFWEFVGSTQAGAVLRDELIWHERLLDELQRRLDEGLVREDEVLRVRTAHSFIRLSLLRSQNRARALEEEILGYCNLSAASVLIVDTPSLIQLTRPVNPIPVDMEDVLRNRSDLTAKEFDLLGLEYHMRSQLAPYLPHAFLLYRAGMATTDRWAHEKLVNQSFIRLQVGWNLFDWGEQLRRVHIARNQLAREKLAFENYQLGIERSVRSAERTLNETLEVEKYALETLNNARRSLEMAQLRYREGVLEGSELLRARSEFSRAEQELNLARIDKVLAVEELAVHSGRYIAQQAQTP